MDKKRSVEVTVTSYLLIFIGGVSFIGSFLLFFMPVSFEIRSSVVNLLHRVYPFSSLIVQPLPVNSLLCLLFGVGLLKLKNWLRKTFIIYHSVNVIFCLLYIIFLSIVFIDSIKNLSLINNLRGVLLDWLIPYILFPGFYIYFFTRSKVKEQFRQLY